MKRLWLLGFPCPPEAWTALQPEMGENEVVPLRDLMSGRDANSLKGLAGKASVLIANSGADTLLLHDFAVTIGLLALLRLKKKGLKVPGTIVVFNGAFRGFNVFRNPHPLKVQVLPRRMLVRAVEEANGTFDVRLRPNLRGIRALYRQVALHSIASLLKERFTHSSNRPLELDLGSRILAIASRNDPFIDFACMKRIQADFKNCELRTLDYGHFPYSGPTNEIRYCIEKFEEGAPIGGL